MTYLPSRLRRLVPVLGATALAMAVTTPPSVADEDNGHDALVHVVRGLDGPRGVDASDDERVLFSQGDGTVSVAVLDDDDPVRTRVVGQVPAGFIAPAVARGPRGRVYALTVQGAPGSGSNTLYWLRRGEAPKAVADIAAHQVRDPDPFNLADPPEESNPFGLATLPDGSVLVADAAANDLLRVFPNGQIVTVARFKPRMVTVPAGLPAEPGLPLPPAGTTVASESVPTSVAVGADGYYYVGELRGVPGTPGTSQIWRIKPGSVGAVCDPAHPSSGDCTRFADGFTGIVDLATGADGSVYALELVSDGWLQWELGLVDPPLGGLFLVSPDGDHVTELAVGQLVLPGGVEVAEGGGLYVTGPVFGPGSLLSLGDTDADGDRDQRDAEAED